MKKAVLLINLIIINLIVLSTVSLGSELNYFQSHNKTNKRETGFYYVQTNNSLMSIDMVKRTNSYGKIEKENKDEALYFLRSDFNLNNINSIEYKNTIDIKDKSSLGKIYKKLFPKDDEKFNELMWVLNNLANVNDEKSKDALLAQAGLDNKVFQTFGVNGYTEVKSEKDIIETIQQAAIYYYANQDENKIPKVDANFFEASTDQEQKINLSEAYKAKQDAVSKLYTYLIKTAEKEVKNGYKYSENNDLPITLDKSEAIVRNDNGNNVIGPYLIKETNKNYNFDLKILGDKKELTNVKILGEDGKTEIQGNSINEKIKSSLNKKFYITMPTTSLITDLQVSLKIKYYSKNITCYCASANMIKGIRPIIGINNETKILYQNDSKQISKPKFDLALRTFIQSVNGKATDKKREPEITQGDLIKYSENNSTLNNGSTLVKNQNKTPVSAVKNDKIIYTIRVYNEGEIDGTADKIVNYIPEGMEFVSQEESSINKEYNWIAVNGNNKVVESDYLKDKNIEKFNKTAGKSGYEIDYQDIQIELKVTADTQGTDTMIKDVAEIKSIKKEENVLDRDSVPGNITSNQLKDYNPGTSENGIGYEDDDDCDIIVVQGKYFDLVLREFITQVISMDGKTADYKREPNVDVEPLISGSDSAKYKHIKAPVGIEIGDTIVYNLRIYNEGQIAGFADEIVMHLPEELQYVNDEENAENGWIIDTTDETHRTIKTTKLSKENDEDNAIEAFNVSEKKISYKDIKIKLKIKSTAVNMKEITTIAEITKSSNLANLVDRDNKINASLPSDAELSKYRGNSENKAELSDANYYYNGQEDDDDFEKVILQKFDLALRSFETAMNGVAVTDRIPSVDKTKFETTENGKTITTLNYTNKKDVIKVKQNDNIEITTRVYNEGTQDGYVSEIKGTLEDGMTFNPQDPINFKYEWKMYDSDGNETFDTNNVKFIKTNYYSKEKNSQTNLIKSFDKATMIEPNYVEVKAVITISEIKDEHRDQNIRFEIAKADGINEEKVTDIDSVPNEWNDGEDDQDQESIHIDKFDLKLEQKLTKAMIIEEGKQKDQKIKNKKKKDAIKVEIDKKQVENVVIKFEFTITVANEGETEGYATEISDYIPQGLKFNQADNIDWKEINNKIVTGQLKNELIKPGESKDVKLTLTWVNDENNTKIMQNVAEISEDKNNSKTKDFDSTPNNRAEGEDDMDSAEVRVDTTSKQNKKIILIISIFLVVIGVGIILIKKFVL